jgi:hypothetical protein
MGLSNRVVCPALLAGRFSWRSPALRVLSLREPGASYSEALEQELSKSFPYGNLKSKHLRETLPASRLATSRNPALKKVSLTGKLQRFP